MQRCVSSLTILLCTCTFTGLSGLRPEGEAGPLSLRLKEGLASACADTNVSPNYPTRASSGSAALIMESSTGPC
jgi:hypothetical protein